MTRPRTRRLVAAAMLALLLCAGLTVHVVLPETSATDIAGDILYAAAVYTGLVLLAPRAAPLVVAAVAAVWGLAIELFQLTGLPAAAGAAFPPAALVLGTVFDPRDLVIALVVPVAAGAIDAAVSTRRRLSTDDASSNAGRASRR